MAAITGIGVVSALGRGVGPMWSAMAEGRDGLAPIRRFDPAAAGIATRVGGVVPDRNAPEHAGSGARLCAELAIDAARQAWQRARLDEVPRDRIALVFGSSLGEPDVVLGRIAEEVGTTLGIIGPRITVSTACSSSSNAIGVALDLLAMGVVDAAIAGGADVLTPLVLAGFEALGVLSATKCAPFSEPPGTTLGEGAGFVVLERDATRAPSSLAVLGYGLSADAFHDTGPDPSGAGVARGMRSALAHAGVGTADVDYINAHGTGTLANDPAEWRAIQHVFGARADALPVSASKSFLGHGQGAAGVLETIATLVAMERGAIPPTMHYTTPRPNSPRDAVGQATARTARCEVAVCASSGFGGANCSLVVGRRARTREVTRRRVALVGSGLVEPEDGGRVPIGMLERVAPSIDPRGLDPTTRYLVAATALALANAGIRLVGDMRDRSGLVVGQLAISAESDRALHRTIAGHGYRGMSASLFARQVLNAATGTCARVLGLRGATSTLSTGPSTGLAALAYAAELVATRSDCDRVAATAVDELADDAELGAREGAACAVVAAAASGVEVAGWSLAGPGRTDLAMAGALVAARLEAVDRVVDLGSASGAIFEPLRAVLHAAAELRAGHARHAMIAHAGGGSAACAIVLTGDRHAH